MSLPILFLLYIIITASIFALSSSISYFGNLWERKSKVSSSIISGVLLGAITGFPELIVNTISCLDPSVKSEIGCGDVLGSNLLNFVFLALGAFIFFKFFKKTQIGKLEIIQLTTLSIIYIFYALSFLLDIPRIGKAFSIFSIFCFVGWLLNETLMIKNEKLAHPIDSTNHKIQLFSNWHIRKIVIIFFIIAFGLVCVATADTYVSNQIITNLKLDPTFGGSIFISLSTALPEIITVFTLFYLKNTKAAIAAMIGSNIFNVFTLFINDLLSSIFKPDDPLFPTNIGKDHLSNRILSICALGSCLCFFISILIVKFVKLKNNKFSFASITTMTPLVIASLCYPIYLIVYPILSSK